MVECINARRNAIDNDVMHTPIGVQSKGSLCVGAWLQSAGNTFALKQHVDTVLSFRQPQLCVCVWLELMSAGLKKTKVPTSDRRLKEHTGVGRRSFYVYICNTRELSVT